MAWVELVGLALALWATCGAVIAVGRKLWSIDTTLRVHLLAAPVLAFLAAALHRELAPAFRILFCGPLRSRSFIVMLLDALVVAPLFPGLRSYAMFRSRHRDVAAVRRDFRCLLGRQVSYTEDQRSEIARCLRRTA